MQLTAMATCACVRIRMCVSPTRVTSVVEIAAKEEIESDALSRQWETIQVHVFSNEAKQGQNITLKLHGHFFKGMWTSYTDFFKYELAAKQQQVYWLNFIRRISPEDPLGFIEHAILRVSVLFLFGIRVSSLHDFNYIFIFSRPLAACWPWYPWSSWFRPPDSAVFVSRSVVPSSDRGYCREPEKHVKFNALKI